MLAGVHDTQKLIWNAHKSKYHRYFWLPPSSFKPLHKHFCPSTVFTAIIKIVIVICSCMLLVSLSIRVSFRFIGQADRWNVNKKAMNEQPLGHHHLKTLTMKNILVLIIFWRSVFALVLLVLLPQQLLLFVDFGIRRALNCIIKLKKNINTEFQRIITTKIFIHKFPTSWKQSVCVGCGKTKWSTIFFII